MIRIGMRFELTIIYLAPRPRHVDDATNIDYLFCSWHYLRKHDTADCRDTIEVRGKLCRHSSKLDVKCQR